MFVNVKLLTCDTCPAELEGVGPDATVARMSKLARAKGWLVGRDGHLCPTCRDQKFGKPSAEKLSWHRDPDGGIFAKTRAGHYRIVKHTYAGYTYGYDVITPFIKDNPLRGLNQRAAKRLAQEHFDKRFR